MLKIKVFGGVAEWSNVPHSKCGVRETGPWAENRSVSEVSTEYELQKPKFD